MNTQNFSVLSDSKAFKMLFNLRFILFTIFTIAHSTAEKARYDFYRVYHIAIENELQLRVLKELSEISDSVRIILFLIDFNT